MAVCSMFVALLTLANNSVDAAWGISAPLNNSGDRQENYGDLQTWGQAPVGETIRVEVWRDGTKIDEQVIGPLPAQSGSGGGGGWWWANFAAPNGKWNGTYMIALVKSSCIISHPAY